MSFNFSREIKCTRVMNAVAAGVTDSSGSSVDMKGFDSVAFLASFGAITATAVTSLKAQQSADDSSFADLEGTAISVSTDNGNDVAILEIPKPRERYVKPIVDRGTANAVIDGIIAVQYNADKVPVTQDAATILGTEFHHAPAEGTA